MDILFNILGIILSTATIILLARILFLEKAAGGKKEKGSEVGYVQAL